MPANPDIFLPLVEKLLLDAEHIRNKLEVAGACIMVLNKADDAVESIRVLSKAIKNGL